MNDEELEGLIAPPSDAGPASEPAPEGPARGPDGKFVAKEPAPASEPDAPKQPPLSEKETVGFYQAMQAERDKRQALERELAAYKAKAEPPAEPTPDQALAQQLYNQKLIASRKFAEAAYGKDAIAAVHDWVAARCDADPAFNALMRSSDDPYEAAKAAYDREQIVAQVQSPDDLAAFKAWKAQQAAQAAPAPEPSPQTEETPVPRSLATAPGNGAAGKTPVPTHAGAAFESFFQR